MSFGGGGGAPAPQPQPIKQPPVIQPTPAPEPTPTPAGPTREEIARRGRGRIKTTLTGGAGVADEAQTRGKTLLGQ